MAHNVHFVDAADRAAASEKRRLKRIAERHANKVCYACREMGHAAQLCPNVKPEDQANGANPAGICYRYACLSALSHLTPKPILTLDVALKSTLCLSVGNQRTQRILCHSRHVSYAQRKAISRRAARKTRIRVSTRMVAHVNFAERLRISQ